MLSLQAYGRVASDIEVKQSKDGKHLYTNFLIASHEKCETTYMRCVAFDAMASLLNEFFSKGDRILLKGDLIGDDYKNRKYSFKMKVRDFEFVETLDEHNKNKQRNTRKES